MAGNSRSGAKKLPKEIKELKGTLRPWRENKNAPQPGRALVLEPPAHLNEIAAAEYAKKAELLDRLGVFKEGDDVALASYAEAYARWVEAVKVINADGMIIYGKNEMPMRNPALYIINNSLDQIHKFLVEFGLTPASRSKIKVDTKPKENEWEVFSSGELPKTEMASQKLQ